MNNLKLPAEYAPMSEEEMTYVAGGDALSIAVKTVVAVGVSAALLYVAAVAAKGILSIFNPNTYTSLIDGSVNGGKNFIDNSLNAGQNFLDGLMGK